MTVTEERDPRLDWRARFDERSRSYASRDVIDFSKPLKKRVWQPGPVLDQGREGACVGFGWSGELAASPIRVKRIDDAFALDIYRGAQRRDQWPGEDYEGTSVIAGAQECKARGYIGEYRWAFNADDLKYAVAQLGCAVIGVNWYYGMYSTTKTGMVNVTGRYVGGHCLYIYGYNPAARIAGEDWHKRFEVFMWQNSWGPNYGLNGRGYLRVEDAQRLIFDENGEACIPLQRTTKGTRNVVTT